MADDPKTPGTPKEYPEWAKTPSQKARYDLTQQRRELQATAPRRVVQQTEAREKAAEARAAQADAKTEKPKYLEAEPIRQPEMKLTEEGKLPVFSYDMKSDKVVGHPVLASVEPVIETIKTKTLKAKVEGTDYSLEDKYADQAEAFKSARDTYAETHGRKPPAFTLSEQDLQELGAPIDTSTWLDAYLGFGRRLAAPLAGWAATLSETPERLPIPTLDEVKSPSPDALLAIANRNLDWLEWGTRVGLQNTIALAYKAGGVNLNEGVDESAADLSFKEYKNRLTRVANFVTGSVDAVQAWGSPEHLRMIRAGQGIEDTKDSVHVDDLAMDIMSVTNPLLALADMVSQEIHASPYASWHSGVLAPVELAMRAVGAGSEAAGLPTNQAMKEGDALKMFTGIPKEEAAQAMREMASSFGMAIFDVDMFTLAAYAGPVMRVTAKAGGNLAAKAGARLGSNLGGLTEVATLGSKVAQLKAAEETLEAGLRTAMGDSKALQATRVVAEKGLNTVFGVVEDARLMAHVTRAAAAEMYMGHRPLSKATLAAKRVQAALDERLVKMRATAEDVVTVGAATKQQGPIRDTMLTKATAKKHGVPRSFSMFRTEVAAAQAKALFEKAMLRDLAGHFEAAQKLFGHRKPTTAATAASAQQAQQDLSAALVQLTHARRAAVEAPSQAADKTLAAARGEYARALDEAGKNLGDSVLQVLKAEHDAQMAQWLAANAEANRLRDLAKTLYSRKDPLAWGRLEADAAELQKLEARFDRVQGRRFNNAAVSSLGDAQANLAMLQGIRSLRKGYEAMLAKAKSIRPDNMAELEQFEHLARQAQLDANDIAVATAQWPDVVRRVLSKLDEVRQPAKYAYGMVGNERMQEVMTGAKAWMQLGYQNVSKIVTKAEAPVKALREYIEGSALGEARYLPTGVVRRDVRGSSLFDQGLRGLRAVAGASVRNEEAPTKMVSQLANAWLPRKTWEAIQDPAAVEARLVKALNAMLLQEDPSITTATTLDDVMNTLLKVTSDALGMSEDALRQSGEVSAYSAAALAMEQGAAFTHTATAIKGELGGITDEVLKAASFLTERTHDAGANYEAAMKVFDTFDMPATMRQNISKVGQTLASGLEYYDLGYESLGTLERVMVPRAWMNRFEQEVGHAVKSIEPFHRGEQSAARSLFAEPLQWANRWWSTAVTAGLYIPRGAYYTAMYVGTLSQTMGEVGPLAAARLGAEATLDATLWAARGMQNAPVVGKAIGKFYAKMAQQLGVELDHVLPSIVDTMTAVPLHMVYDPKYGDNILVKGIGNTRYTFGELREMLALHGAFESEINSAGLLDLVKRADRKAQQLTGQAPSSMKGVVQQTVQDLKTAEGVAGKAKAVKRGVGEAGKRAIEPLGDAAEFVKEVAAALEQRQRVALFLNQLLLVGKSPEEAGAAMRRALYSWSSPLSSLEEDYITGMFVFWRFKRLQWQQAWNILKSPFEGSMGPEAAIRGSGVLAEMSGQRSPLGALRDMVDLQETVREQTQERGGASYPPQPFDSQAQLGTYEMSEEEKAYYASQGLIPTHQTMVVPQATQYGPVNQILTGLFAPVRLVVAAYDGRFKRELGLQVKGAGEWLVDQGGPVTSEFYRSALETYQVLDESGPKRDVVNLNHPKDVKFFRGLEWAARATGYDNGDQVGRAKDNPGRAQVSRDAYLLYLLFPGLRSNYMRLVDDLTFPMYREQEQEIKDSLMMHGFKALADLMGVAEVPTSPAEDKLWDDKRFESRQRAKAQKAGAMLPD